MKASVILSETYPKSFLWMNLGGGVSKIEEITCTDSEILDGCLEGTIDAEEEYSLFTASSYVGERKVTDLEVGDMIELDSYVMLMRIG